MFVHLSTHVHDVFIAATIAQAYTIRENFREANMLLGIDAMEVYEFYSQLEKEKPTTQNHFFIPQNDPLLDIFVTHASNLRKRHSKLHYL